MIDGVLPSPRLRRGPPPQSRMRRDDVDGGIEKEEEQDGGKEQEQEQEDDDEEAEETKESDEKEGGEEEGEESVDGTGASQPSSNSVKGTENATPPKRTPSWMREDYRTEVAPTSRFASAPQLRAPLRVEVADKALAAARRWGGIEHDSASTSASASASVGQRLSGFSAGHTSATARHADSASLPHTSAVATGRWQSRTPAKQMRSMSARGPPASSAGATLRPGQALVSPQGSSSSASPLPHSPARVASEARQAAAGRLTPPVPVREDEETEGGYTSHSDREGDGPMQGEGGNSSGDAQLPVRGDVDAATLRARRGVPQWLEHSSPVAEGEEEGATTESDREGFAALRAHSLPSLGVIGAPPVPKAPPRRQSNSPLLGPNGPTRNDSRFRTWESAGPGGRLRRGSFPAVGSAVVGPSDALAVAEAEVRAPPQPSPSPTYRPPLSYPLRPLAVTGAHAGRRVAPHPGGGGLPRPLRQGGAPARGVGAHGVRERAGKVPAAGCGGRHGAPDHDAEDEQGSPSRPSPSPQRILCPLRAGQPRCWHA